MTDDKDEDTLQASDDPNTIIDSQGRATTPLHEAMSAAVERTQPDSASDDGDNDADGGDDVDESSSKDDDSTKAAPVANIFQRYASTPDARNAAEQFTPKRFDSPGGNTTHPNQFGERLSGLTTGGAANEYHAPTSDVVQPDDALRIVGGNSQQLDARQEQATYNAISDRRAAHGGGGVDLSAEIAAHDAVVAPVLSVRAAFPHTVALNPLSRTPTPVE
jgi:hypothetical protein